MLWTLTFVKVVKSKHFFVIASLLFVFFIVFAQSASSAQNFKDAQQQFKQVAGSTGAGLDTSGNVEGKAASIIQTALSFIGIAFLALTIYGGLIWMIARGDDAQAKKAKDIIIMAGLGMLVVLLAYAATYLITTEVFKSPTT